MQYKNKFIAGIFIIILGSGIMLFTMIQIIILSAGYLYKNVQEFPVTFVSDETPGQTPNFTLPVGGPFSVWLRLPDRKIENKNIIFSVYLMTSEGQTFKTFKEDFNIGYFRNSVGQNQYYRLGSFPVEEEFDGYFVYSHKGSWLPPYPGQLTVREIKGGVFPVKHILVFVLGLYLLLIGIKTINKNYKMMKM